MSFSTLGCQKVVVTESACLLVCDHVKAEAPLELLVDGPPVFEVGDEIVEGFCSLSSFDAIFVDFGVVVLKESGVGMYEVSRVGADLVDEIEGVVDPFVFAHR